jgi:hypothetical protein
MNCIGKPPLAVSAADLQRKLSSKLWRQRTAFAESHYPLPLHCPPPVRSAFPIGRNMQCESGNFKVVSAAALKTS